MSFILLDYAPFLAVAFADVLNIDSTRYPCVLSIRERARCAMTRWSPSKRLCGLTGEALDQTVAEAVTASHDLRLPPEHMPLESLDGEIPSKRKKKKKPRQGPVPSAPSAQPTREDTQAPQRSMQRTAADPLEEIHESDGIDDENEGSAPALCMAHHTWQWLTCADVVKWAMASKKQARDYYRLSSCSCCEHVPPWSFLQDDLAHSTFEEPRVAAIESTSRGPTSGAVEVEAALTESEKFAETAESEDSDPSECSSAISTADLPNGHPQEKSAELTVKTSSADCTDVDMCQETGACQVPSGLPDASQVQAVGPLTTLRTDVTFKGVLRQLLQQLHGLHNLSRQHPFWLHTTLSESFRLSACSKAHAALFEEAAALAVIRRQQQLRGDILCDDTAFDEPWEEDDLCL